MAVFYGVSVGPGDPKDITIKALECLRDTQVLAFASSGKEESVVYPILEKLSEQTLNFGFHLHSDKEILFLSVPMTREKSLLERARVSAAEKIKAYLCGGRDVAFPVLGDVGIYSSYQYIAERLRSEGFETKSICGVPSFCAAASVFEIGLSHREESILIHPSSYEKEALRQAISRKGTTVLMKPGKNWKQLTEYIKEQDKDVCMVEYLGGEKQRLYRGITELPETAPYLSILILRDKKEREKDSYANTLGGG